MIRQLCRRLASRLTRNSSRVESARYAGDGPRAERWWRVWSCPTIAPPSSLARGQCPWKIVPASCDVNKPTFLGSLGFGGVGGGWEHSLSSAMQRHHPGSNSRSPRRTRAWCNLRCKSPAQRARRASKQARSGGPRTSSGQRPGRCATPGAQPVGSSGRPVVVVWFYVRGRGARPRQISGVRGGLPRVRFLGQVGMGHMDNSRNSQPCPGSQVPASLAFRRQPASPTVLPTALLEGAVLKGTPISISRSSTSSCDGEVSVELGGL